PGRTLEGTIVGTPSYMAPEQAAGFAADPRSDIYSVGAVIYQMLAGRVPFEAATFGQLMAKVIAQPAPPLGTLTPSGERISPELAALVMSSLEKDPRRRPESMTLLGQALAAIERAGAAPRRKLHWKSIALKATPALLAVVSVAAFLRLPEHGAAVPPAPRAELRPIAPPRTMARTPSSAPETQSVNVRIASNPPGARVIRADSGAELGFTPLYRPFSPTERDVVLRLELPGHRPIEQTIQPAERPSVEVKMSRLKLSAKKRSAFKGSREKIGKDGLINPFAELRVGAAGLPTRSGRRSAGAGKGRRRGPRAGAIPRGSSRVCGRRVRACAHCVLGGLRPSAGTRPALQRRAVPSQARELRARGGLLPAVPGFVAFE